MKTLFLVLLFNFSHSLVFTHDVPIAIFHVSESDTSLDLTISFEAEDFLESVGITTSEVNLEGMQAYLNENTRFQFNDQVLRCKLSEVQIIREHIKVRGSFGQFAQKIKNVKIENHCMTNLSKHSNIIQIDLNNTTRDFRMNKKRTKIQLTY